MGALERILTSDLRQKYDFVRMHQNDATGSVDVKRLGRWVRFLRDTRPDLVHVRGLGNEGFHGALAARMAGCPRILVSVHGTVRDLTGPSSVKRRVIVHGLEPATLRLATHVTTVCEFAARRPFVLRHANKFVGPIINGVAPEGSTSGPDRMAMRSDLDVGPDDVAVISVGRLSHDKGHADLADAFRRMSGEQRSSIVLVLVGEGPDEAAIRENYSSSGVVVRSLGRRHDVPNLLAAADVFAFPSLHENLSNALLEAMAQGLPVVATRVGGNTEVVSRGGGLLVEPHNPEQLQVALTELASHRLRRVELGREASLVVAEHYSVARMLDVLDATYRQVLQGRLA